MSSSAFEPGQRLSLDGPGLPAFATVRFAQPDSDGGWTLVVVDDLSALHEVQIPAGDTRIASVLISDGTAKSARVIAGMWTRWMAAAATNAESTLLASTPLRPYAHQANAVYGAMLPQPLLRFLLADEPGTGKTIMAGLYLREMQRLGLLRRALVVVPAHLVSKWQEDFDRFFGGGLRRISAETVRQHGLSTTHDLWVVSLELAAVNPAVQDAIRPDKAGWDLVIFDEAHRLTPTAANFHQVGRLLAKNTPRALLMTATPHRGKEWLFRHLLHLVDPAIYPDPGTDIGRHLAPLRPGPIHFLRRMKEDLVDYDGTTRLFRGRTATNHAVPLSSREYAIYQQALTMVDTYFVPGAQPLARMVYGKRAASSLYALGETLRRRSLHMGEKTEAEAALDAEREFEDDETAADEAKVVHAGSTAAKAERAALKELVKQVQAALADAQYEPSKWRTLLNDCLAAHGITRGSGEQAVIFTEYADTADWITKRLVASGFSARMYSGRQKASERDNVRSSFMRREFQIIVTTDAGNEGIDLQVAHVLTNYDIPWSLVRLEQRMGRIHRVGQTEDVFLHNLIAIDTREGETLHVLLENFVTAANELGGQMFDSLSAIAEITGVEYEQWLTDLYGNDAQKKSFALEAARKVQAHELKRAAQQAHAAESMLSTQVDAMAALTLLQRDLLARINPAIVESYLARLDAAGVVSVRPTAAGEGILLLKSRHALPTGLGSGTEALVGTSADALRTSERSVDLSNVFPLGPGEQAFGDLITLADEALAVDRYRSGAADDPTSVTAYDLYAFETLLSEGNGRRKTAWAALIRVNDNGQTYPARWETLANLVTSDQPGTSPHPAREGAAVAAARALADETVTNHQKVRSEWFAQAGKDLQGLPTNLTVDIADRSERIALRKRLDEQTVNRLAELEDMSRVTIGPPRLAARIRVHPAAIPPTVQEKDSEIVAMRHVQRLLAEEDWQVADVHADDRGYDLHAVRGRERRLVEVKGVWDSAASVGIGMTGNEVLIATQHRNEYWLYVIDGCVDGTGRLFGSFRDPTTLFAGDIKGVALFRVPGSSLSRAARGDIR